MTQVQLISGFNDADNWRELDNCFDWQTC